MLPEWFVAFHPTTSAWWSWLCPVGFGHVYAFAYDLEARAWIGMEPAFEGVVIRVMPPELVSARFGQAHAGEIRLLRARTVGHRAVRPRLCVTCAGAVAGVLGLRRWPLTPLGLFWALRRMGAEEIGCAAEAGLRSSKWACPLPGAQ